MKRWAVAVGLGLAIFLLNWSQSALATEGEHNTSHCAFRGATTEARYLLTPSGSQETPTAEVASATATARIQWNNSGAAPTQFATVGYSDVPRHIRVYEYVESSSTIAAFGASCASLGGSWVIETAIRWNRLNHEGLSLQQRANTAVHEFGHAAGLAHAGQSCSGSTPLAVMASGVSSWNCSQQYGPYGRDTAAAVRVKTPAKFTYRNGLTSGSSTVFSWQTENDDFVFRGDFGTGNADRFGSFDNDVYGVEAGSLWNSRLYRTSAGSGAPQQLRNNITTGAEARNNGRAVGGRLSGGSADAGLAYVTNQLHWFLATSVAGTAGSHMWFGAPGDIPLLGDWNGDGLETVAVFRSSTGQWFFRNSNTSGPAQFSFYFGNPGDIPVVGNWDTADAHDEIGVVRGNTWYLRRHLTPGPADVSFVYGTAPMQPLLGDWDGDGDATPAFHR